MATYARLLPTRIWKIPLFRTLVLTFVFACANLSADPAPGDIFREYVWKGPWVNASDWQRVTDPKATRSGAKVFLPNPVNSIQLDDLTNAIGAEIYLEQWGGHAGTSNKRLRINGGAWIPIPEPSGIPGDAGIHKDPECYQYFTYPAVSLPLDALVEGENTFEFTCDGQICFSFGWGQWGVYGVTFRIYYDEAKPHPTGSIIAPVEGHFMGNVAHLEAEATSANSTIERVDFMGLYEDFDYEGNGIYRQWHYIYRYGEIQHHLGTAFSVPFVSTWHTEWVPDQTIPMQMMARIKDAEGIYYMTRAVGDITLERPERSVKLYKPYNVPARWQSREITSLHTAKVYIDHDLQKATAARLVLATWSGSHAEAIGINDSMVVPSIGWYHNYSLDQLPLPIDLMQEGINTVFTKSTTIHHGIEVLWPGIAVLVQYEGAVGPSVLPTGDAVIFGDQLMPAWRLEGKTDFGIWFDTQVDISSEALPYQGELALNVEASKLFWQLDLIPAEPVYVDGYKALRFAFRAKEISTQRDSWFHLKLNDHSVSLLDLPEREQRIDMDLQEWQVVIFPLESFAKRYSRIESLQLNGKFKGSFSLDDIRLVASAPPTTVVEESNTELPLELALALNYPNPFNSTTAIRFALPAEGQVRLNVYNLIGQKVTSLIDGRRPAGRYTVHWDGRDESGHELASGAYLYRLQIRGQTKTRKLLLLK